MNIAFIYVDFICMMFFILPAFVLLTSSLRRMLTLSISIPAFIVGTLILLKFSSAHIKHSALLTIGFILYLILNPLWGSLTHYLFFHRVSPDATNILPRWGKENNLRSQRPIIYSNFRQALKKLPLHSSASSIFLPGRV